MGDNKAKLRKELMSYGKEDIVNALLEQFGYESIVNGCLVSLHKRMSKALLDDEKKTSERAEAALDAYFLFLKSMGEKYGSEGGNICISKLSVEDLEKLSKVVEELERAQKARDEAFKRTERFMGIK